MGEKAGGSSFLFHPGLQQELWLRLHCWFRQHLGIWTLTSLTYLFNFRHFYERRFHNLPYVIFKPNLSKFYTTSHQGTFNFFLIFFFRTGLIKFNISQFILIEITLNEFGLSPNNTVFCTCFKLNWFNFIPTVLLLPPISGSQHREHSHFWAVMNYQVEK